jgi:hypothetical protein
MMSASIPKSCLDDIQRMQRSFIWGDTDQKKKYCAVRWDKITVPKWRGGLGIRNLDAMNKACLAKLNFKLQSGCEDLWCKVMHGKYQVQGNGIAKATDSSLRKSLAKLDPLLQQFSTWIVGDGRDIDAWSAVWIEEGLCLEKILNIPPHLIGLKVCDLVDVHGEWNWSLMSSWMPVEFQQKIAAVCPPNQDNGRDVRAGVGGQKSEYSVACMYNNICGFHDKNENSVWHKVWKVKVSERIRAFIWMAMHDRLLTNSNKNKMGLGHAMCNYCGDVEETTMHVLRDCPIASNMWNQVVPVNSRGVFFMGEAQAWFEFNVLNSEAWSWRGRWCEFWATACHCLWYWRNKELFDDNFVRPMNPIKTIMQKTVEYDNAARLNGIITSKSSMVKQVGWMPPREGFIKINTDGAVG